MYWLFKSEPAEFGIEDLAAADRQTTRWDQIRNYQARNFIRDSIALGDQVFFYHSQCRPTGIAGLAQVVSAPYPDPTQFDPHHDYFDPKSTTNSPRWYSVDIQLVRVFNTFLPLSVIRQQPELQQMCLLRQGRLSVQPVTHAEAEHLLNLAREVAESDRRS